MPFWGILLPGAVCLVVIAALLWFRSRWFNAATRVALIAVLVVLALGSTFYLAYPGLKADDWQAAAGAAGVFVALATATVSIYQNGQLAKSQQEMTRFQQKQAEHEEARPELLPDPFPFRDSRMVGYKTLHFRVANRGRSPTAVEIVRLHEQRQWGGNESWNDSKPLKIVPAEPWPGQGDMTIPGGTIRTFLISGKSFRPEEAKTWLEGRTIYLEMETVTGNRDIILLGQTTRIQPPVDEKAEAWFEQQEQEEKARELKESLGPWWKRLLRRGQP